MRKPIFGRNPAIPPGSRRDWRIGHRPFAISSPRRRNGASGRLIERETPADWNHGRVALLGDAAHAMLPFLAQGAAQAIEDAAALAAALEPGGDIVGALAAYSARRTPRAARVQSESRRQALIYHLGLPASLVRDMALRSLGPRLTRRYDWVYGAKNHAIS